MYKYNNNNKNNNIKKSNARHMKRQLHQQHIPKTMKERVDWRPFKLPPNLGALLVFSPFKKKYMKLFFGNIIHICIYTIYIDI